MEDFELEDRMTHLESEHQEWLNDSAAQAEYREYLDSVNEQIFPFGD
jgi:hypothetical protein